MTGATRLDSGAHSGAERPVFDLFSPAGLELGRRHVTDGFEQSLVVPPMHPAKGGELDVLDGPPGAFALVVDELGLVEAIDGLGQRVVVTVTFGSDRTDSPLLFEALCVADGQILTRPCRNDAPGL